VAAPETFALRQRVLRPHQTPDEMALPGDDDPETAHFAARPPDGTVVGTASVRRQAPPWDPGDAGAWRLRGMATAPEMRGMGVGARILGAVVDHVAGRGGGLLWCNARTAAVSLYERGGMQTRGEVWEEEAIGPHVAMWRRVPDRSCPTMPAMPDAGARISAQDVAHVARLARLELSDEELALFTEQLAAVLDHAADVASLDTSAVAPTAHPLPLDNVLRDDEPRPPLDREEVLSQAPEVENGRFKVPRILGEAP